MAVRDMDLKKVWDDGIIIEKNIKFLMKPAKPVQFPISPHVKQIIEDLIDTYQAISCAGIAANQIGYDKKLFIGMKHVRNKDITDDPSQNIDNVEPDADNYEIYINPQIDTTYEKSTQRGDEGCLSIPGLTLDLERYDKIKVRYYNIEGRVMPKPPTPLTGFLSRLYQHELDHLEGRLMLQHKNILNADYWFHDNKNEALLNKLKKYCNLELPPNED